LKANPYGRSERSAWGRIGRLVTFVLLPLVAPMVVIVLFTLVLRYGGPRVRDKIRLLNKRILNPALMPLAGRRHFYAAVIRHRGRRSGREYATPVLAVPVAGNAFLVPLPYGEGVDWLKNVLAAGRAIIEAKGEIHELVEPEVIDAAEALPLLAALHRRMWRRFGIERVFRAKGVRRDL
jgi:deazaflavin-dependent oxidoreductase (nitroreductase family)